MKGEGKVLAGRNCWGHEAPPTPHQVHRGAVARNFLARSANRGKLKNSCIVNNNTSNKLHYSAMNVSVQDVKISVVSSIMLGINIISRLTYFQVNNDMYAMVFVSGDRDDRDIARGRSWCR